MRDNRINLKNYFFETHKRREIFIKNTTEKITRKVARKHLAQLHLACELVKVIRHFFPDLLPMLKNIMDPRNQSYITYQNHVLLMTRILSSIFYISSMRKTSEEFNSERMIENIGYLCEQELLELPYWETINNYLEKLEPQELQDIVSRLVRRLLRSRAFESARVRGKYWQVILDGTQLESSRKELDPKSLYRVHNRGTEKEYTEYYHQKFLRRTKWKQQDDTATVRKSIIEQMKPEQKTVPDETKPLETERPPQPKPSMLLLIVL